ncbi:TetR family transcriptional regulator protein [Calothrix parasitica NIES-267]|uniref:TetR family transcriptional regulator protein n=1 Tax=Calothrix parasitica NIES-267 TaxID=1973488 RepID=A0A1Z4LYA9_9CYAN|nr:TetR family transcriptional regulator protein [Calothrix parasitica NIES-267]
MKEDNKSQGRPRSIESHRAILKATLELLSEVGYERMSIEGIASRAKVGKSTIYRRYKGKEELVADAIESIREEVVIPDTGNIWTDIDALIENAARITFNPLGKQAVATIISSASSNPEFAQIYSEKYLQPRKEAFAVVIKRAKARKEVQFDLDADFIFDVMSGMMLYGLIFPPISETWEKYVRRAIEAVINNQ